jgi:hypothetical protein
MAVPRRLTHHLLPSLVLERICEYLGDDFDRKRSSLWAFSLASRACYYAAIPERFSQVLLYVPGGDMCDDDMHILLERWNRWLKPESRYRHVRHLKVSRTRSGPRDPMHYIYDYSMDGDFEDWRMQGSFDLHNFCSPSTSSIQHLPATTDDPHAWVSLARFIGQLPGLQDLVWACSISLPPPILDAVRNRGCRLHLHQFLVTGLNNSNIQSAMDPYNTTQASFPYLSSMVLHHFLNGALLYSDHPA